MKKMIIVLVLVWQSVFSQTLHSPDGNLELLFSVSTKGEPVYSLNYRQHVVVKPGKLGLLLSGNDSLSNGFIISSADSSLFDQVWQPVWGEEKEIKNQYHELVISLVQKKESFERQVIIRFRLFNDGLGFRYEIPRQDALRHFIVTEELTVFALAGDHKTFWIPGDYDSNEYAYFTTRLSQVNALRGKAENGIGLKTMPGENVVQSPLMMITDEKLYINIFEAALTNYPAMQLNVDKQAFSLSAHLVPDAAGNKAYLASPCVTPWRVIIVSDKATGILASRIILNLNEPCEIEDVSWIKPAKYVGVWWEMHVGKATWNYSDESNINIHTTDWSKLTPNGKHGANTGNVKKYIDFASRNGFDAVLIEGWNIGWEDWFGAWKEEVFDFVTPYPDFDVKWLSEYARSKNIRLIMHHETSSSVTNYERQMDTAFRFMKFFGYPMVKTGYVGRIIPRGEAHDGQWMVNHFTRVAQKTARYRIMLNSHESVRPTGMQRTYPNWLACEAARGNEFNAWSAGNPPEHETILPFTRLLGGPMDYTPGIFNIKTDHTHQVHTTLCKQLALYITMYSPLQMAADLPENYEKHADAFGFIRDVPVEWDQSEYLEAEPGDHLTIVRKEKNGNRWFLGAVTDENPRVSKIALTFLQSGTTYKAILYNDAPDAHWQTNPEAYIIQQCLVKSSDVVLLKLAAGGGAAVIFAPATENELKSLKKYKALK